MDIKVVGAVIGVIVAIIVLVFSLKSTVLNDGPAPAGPDSPMAQAMRNRSKNAPASGQAPAPVGAPAAK